MSDPNSKQPNNNPTLAELRARAFEIVNAAKVSEKLRRQIARDEVREIKRRTNAELAAERQRLLREHQRRETEVKLDIGAAMLEQIATHGLENACLTPAELKIWSADAYAQLLSHLQATKELKTERSASRKKPAPKAEKVEANASKADRPIDRESPESGEIH